MAREIAPGHTRSEQVLRLFTLNIAGPSIDRARLIDGFLADAGADVIVLTETRDRPGTEHILGQFRARGYSTVSRRPTASGERGLAIVHRLGGAGHGGAGELDLPHRFGAVRARLGEIPIAVVGAYVPSRDASPPKIERKRRFIEQLAAELRGLSIRGEHLILLGDLNVVGRSHVPRYAFFRAWEYELMAELSACGMVDAFAHLHPGVQPHSWFGRTGDGYCYDYAFVDRGLASHVVSCEYVDEPRARGLSDHSGVLLTISSSPVGPPHDGDPQVLAVASSA